MFADYWIVYSIFQSDWLSCYLGLEKEEMLLASGCLLQVLLKRLWTDVDELFRDQRPVD